MQFQNLEGLKFPKQVLRNIVESERIPHALLFSGKAGGAQLALALRFATYLNCTQRQAGDSCGHCKHCTKSARFLHPDLNFVLPVTTSAKHSAIKDAKTINYLSSWYAFLKDNIYPTLGDWANYSQADANKQCAISKQESTYIKQLATTPPFIARRKCIFIWLPETMHPSTANAILKILEEPTENIVFILITNQIDKLLSTIVSRAQIIEVMSFSKNELENSLTQHFTLNAEQRQSIVFLSQGNMNKAFKLASDSQGELHIFPNRFKEWFRKCYTNEFDELVKYAETFSRWTKEQQKQFIEFSIQWLREALMSIYEQKQIVYLNETDMNFIQKFKDAITPEGIEKAVQRWNTAFYEIDRNANSKMLFLDMSITAIQALKKNNE